MKSDAAQLPEDDTPTELESQLEGLIRGEVSQIDFLRTFLNAHAYIMVNGEPQGNVLGDKQPMVIAAAPDAPRLLAVFSSPRQAQRMVEHFSDYCYPILVSAGWVFEHLGSHMGIAFNPGCANGFELAPEGAQQLKKAMAKSSSGSG